MFPQVVPRDLKRAIGEFQPQFAGWEANIINIHTYACTLTHTDMHAIYSIVIPLPFLLCSCSHSYSYSYSFQTISWIMLDCIVSIRILIHWISDFSLCHVSYYLLYSTLLNSIHLLFFHFSPFLSFPSLLISSHALSCLTSSSVLSFFFLHLPFLWLDMTSRIPRSWWGSSWTVCTKT